MGLEDFERGLAASKQESQPKDRSRDKREHHHHRHHHRSSRHLRDHHHERSSSSKQDGRDDDRSDRHRSKRKRSDHDTTIQDSNRQGESLNNTTDEASTTHQIDPPIEDRQLNAVDNAQPKRDAWMQPPSALDIDFVEQGRQKKPPTSHFVAATTDGLDEFQMNSNQDTTTAQSEAAADSLDIEAQHQLSYTFGDSGSQWRMTKLRGVYRQAQDTGRSVDEIAIEKYGGYRNFDDAREEERELDRRKAYGKGYVGLEKPSGEFFQDRKFAAGHGRPCPQAPVNDETVDGAHAQGEIAAVSEPKNRLPGLDATALNKLKAQLMKAKIRKSPDVARLEAEYNAAAATFASTVAGSKSDVVLLNSMNSRELTGRGNEVIAITNKRGVERGLVEENEHMSIEDMVRQEKRTRDMGSEGRQFAERIAKDGRFADDLDYMDDNAIKLAKRAPKSEINLRTTAIGDYQRMQRTLDACPLCHHEDTNQPPAAPIVSLGTRTYLTLPTEPELTSYGAVIVPIQHRLNLIECDDDEWEEMRNFMKSLTRMYHERDRGVIFYENAAATLVTKRHAALVAVPLPRHHAESAPAFFKEAILEQDEEWSQHKKIIDTLALSAKPGFGRWAFRKALVKEMPYFHVWFTMDGGAGHIIEDSNRWPRGDLFARQVLGGMLDKAPDVVKKQGRWQRQDPRVAAFRKLWDKFDWTKILVNAD